MTARYSGLAHVYPIMVAEALWAAVPLRRFATRSRVERRNVVAGAV